MSEINVVPYIDVMLVLLVIFMITAPLLTQGVKVDLPQAEAEPIDVETQEPLVVTIDAAGGYYVNYGGRSGLPGRAAGPRGPGRRPAAPSAGAGGGGTRRRERSLRGRRPPDGDPAARRSAERRVDDRGAAERGAMSREPFLGRLLPAVYALLLHAAVGAVLVFSLRDTPEPVAAGPRAEPVEAVVVDEKQIADELGRLRERDRQRREKERERIERLEKEAEAAHLRRTEEERRLSELERLQRERQREYVASERERERQEAERLEELKRKREAEAKRVEELEKQKKALSERRAEEEKRLARIEQKRREEAEKKRRIEEQARVARAEQAHAEAERRKAEEAGRKAEEKRKRVEAERKRIEEEKRRAEAERRKAEEARRKAEEERRREEAEMALQEEIARAAQQLEEERRALLDAGRAEYIAQVKDKIERNWLRPPGAVAGAQMRGAGLADPGRGGGAGGDPHQQRQPRLRPLGGGCGVARVTASGAQGSVAVRSPHRDHLCTRGLDR